MGIELFQFQFMQRWRFSASLTAWVIIVLVVTNYSLAKASYYDSLKVYSKQYYISGIHESNVVVIRGTKRLEIDNKSRAIALFDGSRLISSYKDSSRFPDYKQKQRIFEDRESLTGLFEKNIIVDNVSYADIHGDEILLSHMYFTGWYHVRIVQIIDTHMKVISAFTDTFYVQHQEIVHDVVLFDSDSTMIATGEKGEIIRYNQSGQIMHRYIVNEKLFNVGRSVRPPHDTAIGAAFSIKLAGELISKRDKSVVGTTSLALPEINNIQDFAVGENGRVTILSENVLYEINFGTNTSVNKYDLKQISSLRVYADDYERFFQVKERQGRLYLLSDQRLAEFDRENNRLTEHQLYNIVQPAPYSSWECVRKPQGGFEFYYFKPGGNELQSVSF